MATRRRIDWTVLPGVDERAAVWGEAPAQSDIVGTLAAFSELFEIDEVDLLLRRVVELSLSRVGLVRAGIYLYDEPADLMLGTWGTDLEGQIVDEHHAMFELGESGRHVFARAISGEAYWTVVDNCPIIDQRGQETKVVGRGWVVCTPVRSGDLRLGMLYNDAGLTAATVDAGKQAQTAVLCSLVGAALHARRQVGSRAIDPVTTTRHPLLRKAVQRLAHNPALGGKAMAQELGISVSRLARLFRSELGVSLVDYRNQLRLDRFMMLVDAGTENLLQAALAAGFGSYAQFHRVFRAVRGKAPRAYLLARGLRVPERE